MITCLISGNRGKQYSQAIRKFCFRQFYYSPAGYQSLRDFFSSNLPTRRVIQMWYSTVDGSPGINQSAMGILREKALSFETQNGHKLHLTLISDEMAIRKQICWSNDTQSFSGFSSNTNSSQHPGDKDENIPKLQVAKDALVFMVVGPDFKLAVGYYLLNGLDSIDRAALTVDTIRSVEATGAVVMSLTSDGLKANVVVAQELGAQFDKQITYIHSPTYPEKKFFIIFDPPHMLKLVRKQFSEKALSHQNRPLNWDLLRVLVVKQSSGNFNLRNKLTDHHIKWYQKPMNVRMAAETISNSVANALEQLRQDGYAEFIDNEATVEFLRIFNNAFDILNIAQKTQSDDGYKQRICNNTAEIFFSFLEKFKQYILDLEIKVKTKKKGEHKNQC